MNLPGLVTPNVPVRPQGSSLGSGARRSQGRLQHSRVWLTEWGVRGNYLGVGGGIFRDQYITACRPNRSTCFTDKHLGSETFQRRRPPGIDPSAGKTVLAEGVGWPGAGFSPGVCSHACGILPPGGRTASGCKTIWHCGLLVYSIVSCHLSICHVPGEEK